MIPEKEYRKFIVQFTQLQLTARLSTKQMSNGWITYGPMNVYLRFGPKLIKPTHRNFPLTQCLQIATVSVPPSKQRQGIFRCFLADIKEVTDLSLYIENVLIPEFADALVKNYGFEIVSQEGEIPCLFLERKPVGVGEDQHPWIAAP